MKIYSARQPPQRGPLRTRTIVAVGMLSLALGACSPGEELAERVLESQEGVGDVEIDEDSGEVRIEGEDDEGGSFTLGGGELPDDFPIAVPDDAEVFGMVESEDGASVQLSIPGGSFDDVVDFYVDWIGDSGLEETQKIETSNPPSRAWTLEDDVNVYTISVAEVGEDVAVSIFVLEN